MLLNIITWVLVLEKNSQCKKANTEAEIWTQSLWTKVWGVTLTPQNKHAVQLRNWRWRIYAVLSVAIANSIHNVVRIGLLKKLVMQSQIT